MSIIEDFKKFVLRGSLLDMAVGFTVGAAFTTIAKSLVSDIIMPVVGFLLGDADFSDLFVLLKAGSKSAPPYATLQAAQGAGAITVNYGVFINHFIAFLMVAFAMFLLIRSINTIEETLDEKIGGEKPKPGEPSEKKCRFCKQTIPFKASKCSFCTSELEAVDET